MSKSKKKKTTKMQKKCKKGGSKRKLFDVNNIKTASKEDIINNITENSELDSPIILFLCNHQEASVNAREKVFKYINDSIEKKNLKLDISNKLLTVMTRLQEEAIAESMPYIKKLTDWIQILNKILEKGSNIRNYLCHNNFNFNDPIIIELCKNTDAADLLRKNLKTHIKEQKHTFKKKNTKKLITVIDTIKYKYPHLNDFNYISLLLSEKNREKI